MPGGAAPIPKAIAPIALPLNVGSTDCRAIVGCIVAKADIPIPAKMSEKIDNKYISDIEKINIATNIKSDPEKYRRCFRLIVLEAIKSDAISEPKPEADMRAPYIKALEFKTSLAITGTIWKKGNPKKFNATVTVKADHNDLVVLIMVSASNICCTIPNLILLCFNSGSLGTVIRMDSPNK
jgi:hypothetical protein